MPASDPDYVVGQPGGSLRVHHADPLSRPHRRRAEPRVDANSTSSLPPPARSSIASPTRSPVRFTSRGVNRRLESANRELARLIRLDELTGLANRRRFDEALYEEWRRAARAPGWVSLAIADIDAFKQFNDALGHLAGDACLEKVGVLIAGQARRAGELAARLGGEEFALLFPGADPGEGAAFAERLRVAVEANAYRHPSSPVATVVTVSVGVASLRAEFAGDARQLVHLADSALYEAKRSGRNRVVSRSDWL